MVRPIVTDIFLLNRKAEPATRDDLSIAQDLIDTLHANAEGCVGLAANMIGFNKRMIVVDDNGTTLLMINPKLTHHSAETYEAEEGCLSHTGTKKTMRYVAIEVEYQDLSFRTHRKIFSDFTAQIIQHELDHCEGILI
jgi:peptide deformylase